jgi:predicted hotdog family 3-hydroxylacyl-ACP dehydratase
MAQTVALHTGYAYHLKNEPTPTGYLGSIKKINIYQLPKVGTTIVSKAEILQEFNGVFLVEVSVFDTGSDLCAQGQFKTVIARS